MHSRIYQISENPIEPADYINAELYSDHWFVSQIADYVNGDVDRSSDIEWLRKYLESTEAVTFSDDSSFVLNEGGKERYFERSCVQFKKARDKTLGLTLSEFAAGGELSMTMWNLRDAYCDKYSFYAEYEDELIPMDAFIRRTVPGTRYYIGGTVDYHY
jgi:hypothetical protein